MSVDDHRDGEVRRAYAIAELAAAYGLSTGFVRLEVARGNLRALRLGRRVLVEADEWDRYLARARGDK
ncbi:MAG: excisionase [Deltaproteobacteria bacterium]|nr:excisionase [Deltaproteobacteria bacterium]